MRKQIIAIWDNVAEDIAGQLLLFPHEAPAIRFFTDVATMPDSQVARHVADYDLVRLGYLEEDGTITPGGRETILTGAAWAATQQTNANKE